MRVSEIQFYVAVAIVPMISVLIMLVGIVLQNSNINARIGELRADFRDLMRAEMAAIRAEMAKNHSEMLHRFAELDARLQRVERL